MQIGGAAWQSAVLIVRPYVRSNNKSSALVAEMGDRGHNRHGHLVVEIHTVTVRSDDARYLLN